MTDAAQRRILDLVSSGRLSAEEASPILDALDRAETASTVGDTIGRASARPAAGASKASSDDAPARAVRIEVSDKGRSVVNLRVPLALGRAALDRIPGLSESITDRVREALSNGYKGLIVDIDDDGDGVRIVIE